MASRGSLWFLTNGCSSVRSTMTLQSVEDADSNLTCQANHVCRLTDIEFQLLLAISNCQKRYFLYWGEQTKFQTAVTIYKQFLNGVFGNISLKIKSGNANNCILGNLIWVGCVDGRPGIWFKIDCNNYKGKRSEALISLAQVTEFIMDGSDKESQTVASKDSKNEDVTVPKPEQLLQVGDRVVWISDEDIPEFAVVRWCGLLDSNSDQFTYGVEFDNPVGSGTGQHRGKQLFKAKMKHASFIPAIGLIKAEVFESGSPVGNAVGVSSPDRCDDRSVDLGFDSSTSEWLNLTSSTKSSPPLNDLLLHNEATHEQSSYLRNKKLEVDRFESHPWMSCDAKIPESHHYNFTPVKCSRAFSSSDALCRREDAVKRMTRCNLEVKIGSMVQVDIPGLTKSKYGVVRWMGRIYNEEIVGIELEEPCSAATNGRFGDNQLFICGLKRGYFAKLSKIRKDDRFVDPCPVQSFGIEECSEVSEPQSCLLADNEYNLFQLLERNAAKQTGGYVRPRSADRNWNPDVGRNLGIQGHHNSCYMDATLFSMFAFNHCFDSLLHRKKDDNDVSLYSEIQSILNKEIVNPLRRNMFVRADKTMKLRQLMHMTGTVRGFLTEEKDPEELLRCLFIDTLKAEPFIKFSSGLTEHSFQLLVDDKDSNSPTTQHLLHSSLHKLNLKLSENPDCLILQLPRCGKNKVFQMILPSQFLKIKDLINSAICYICGKRGTYHCIECLQEFPHDRGGVIIFCGPCSEKVHTKVDRKSHKPNLIGGHSMEDEGVLELFAVICIKTSHYVSFTKCGFLPDSPWVFFDSMADRIGLENGYNVPKITACRHINKYLLNPNEYISSTTKDMPEEIVRFTCDGYICMYRNIAHLNYG